MTTSGGDCGVGEEPDGQGPWPVLPQPGGGQGLAGFKVALGSPQPPGLRAAHATTRAAAVTELRRCPADRGRVPSPCGGCGAPGCRGAWSPLDGRSTPVSARATLVADLVARITDRARAPRRQPRCGPTRAGDVDHDRGRQDASCGRGSRRPAATPGSCGSSRARSSSRQVLRRSPAWSCAGQRGRGAGARLLDPLFSPLDATVRTIATRRCARES